MPRVPIFALGFSVARDWYAIFMFFTVVTGNISTYLAVVAPKLVGDSTPFLVGLVLWWLPLLLALAADFFLIATVVIDPGIVRKRSSPNASSHTVSVALAPPLPGGFNGGSAGGVFGNRHSGGMGMGTQVMGPPTPPPAQVGTPVGNGPYEPSLKSATQCVPGESPTLPKPEVEDVDCHICPVCNMYVEMFDHHCAIIGACIGRFNMGTFILFLLNACSLCFVGFFPSAYVLYLRVSTFDLSRGHIMFLQPEIVFNMLVCCSAIIGGTYTLWLGAHYTIMALQGKNSLYLRRRFIRDKWETLSLSERHGAIPINRYLEKGSWLNLKLVLREVKNMRLAPIFPEREL